MKRYSLYLQAFVFLLILVVISSLIIYFSLTRHRAELIKTAIEEKIHLAETINETVNSPFWMMRIGHYPVVTKTFMREMARPEEIAFCRIVTRDGGVYLSSLEEEGKIIEDPVISQVLESKKLVIRDEVFEDEKIKEIIYPGYGDRAIWIGFSLEKTEKEIQVMFIREGLTTGGGLIAIFLILFMVLRGFINPIKKITTACEEIRKGNLDVKIDVKSKTEIGELVDTLNETIKDLRESRLALEETKVVLEVRVQARTKELQELTERQEEIIEERTKELQEKIEELERFHRLAVGRELRMIELKEEIERLKEELKNYKP